MPHSNFVKDQHSAATRPLAAVLTCGDLSYPMEKMFCLPRGSIFCFQNAMHLADQSALASLEYAAAELRVKAIIVLGHLDCSAMRWAIENPDRIDRCCDAVPRARPDFTSRDAWAAYIFAHIREQAQRVVTGSLVIARLRAAGHLKVAAYAFDPNSRRIRPIDIGL